MTTGFEADKERLDAIRKRRAAITKYHDADPFVTYWEGKELESIRVEEDNKAREVFDKYAPTDIDFLLTALAAANAKVARLQAENAALKTAFDETDRANHDLSSWNEVLQKEIDTLKARVSALEKPKDDGFWGWAISSSLPKRD